MRLLELTGAKRFADLNPADALKLIKREFELGNTKLRPLGKGESGVALTDGKVVYKLWYKDSAYERFIEVARQHQSNPLFPKVLSKIKTLPKFIKLGQIQRDIRFVKLELLEPWTGSTSIKIWEQSAREVTIDELFELCSGGGSVDEFIKRLGKDYKAEYRESMTPTAEVVNLIKALLLIESEPGDSDDFDYQRQNLASRNGQLVLLDPVYNSQDLSISVAVLKLGYVSL